MNKSYYAIIPANVRYDKDLKPNAKLLYGEITALCNEKGYCWANNSYFSDLYKVSNSTISRWISELIKKGYIYSKIIYKNGTKEIIERRIYICNTPIDEKINTPTQKNQGGIDEKINTPIDEKVKDNRESINNTINNNIYSLVIEKLNLLANKKYKSTSRKTQQLIKARLNEGFTLEDFYKVIENKVATWKDNIHMDKYLRPETLFGSKFESYLNENVKAKGGKDFAKYKDYEQHLDNRVKTKTLDDEETRRKARELGIEL